MHWDPTVCQSSWFSQPCIPGHWDYQRSHRAAEHIWCLRVSPGWTSLSWVPISTCLRQLNHRASGVCLGKKEFVIDFFHLKMFVVKLQNCCVLAPTLSVLLVDTDGSLPWPASDWVPPQLELPEHGASPRCCSGHWNGRNGRNGEWKALLAGSAVKALCTKSCQDVYTFLLLIIHIYVYRGLCSACPSACSLF